MEALRIRKTLDKDGELTVEDLPCKKGQEVGVILLMNPSESNSKPLPTVRDLLESGLVGMWKDRTDIEDSAAFARKLREDALRVLVHRTKGRHIGRPLQQGNQTAPM